MLAPRDIDLNLLVVFAALMDTRSVTRTAEKLGLTQPAASAALRRLRAYFGDEMLVQVGKRMHPTPFAEALYPQIQRSLASVEQAIATPAGFDPATSTRRFRINASDYVMVAVLVGLAGVLVMGGLPEVMRDLQVFRDIAYGALLILSVMFMPRGIAGLVRK